MGGEQRSQEGQDATGSKKDDTKTDSYTKKIPMQYGDKLKIKSINTKGRNMHEVRLLLMEKKEAGIYIACMQEIMVPTHRKWDDGEYTVITSTSCKDGGNVAANQQKGKANGKKRQL